MRPRAAQVRVLRRQPAALSLYCRGPLLPRLPTAAASSLISIAGAAGLRLRTSWPPLLSPWVGSWCTRSLPSPSSRHCATWASSGTQCTWPCSPTAEWQVVYGGGCGSAVTLQHIDSLRYSMHSARARMIDVSWQRVRCAFKVSSLGSRHLKKKKLLQACLLPWRRSSPLRARWLIICFATASSCVRRRSRSRGCVIGACALSLHRSVGHWGW